MASFKSALKDSLKSKKIKFKKKAVCGRNNYFKININISHQSKRTKKQVGRHLCYALYLKRLSEVSLISDSFLYKEILKQLLHQQTYATHRKSLSKIHKNKSVCKVILQTMTQGQRQKDVSVPSESNTVDNIHHAILSYLPARVNILEISFLINLVEFGF